MSKIDDLFHEIIYYKEDIKIEDVKIDKDYLLDIHNNNSYNKTISGYYNKLSKEDKNVSQTTASNIEQCNKYFVVNRYDYNQVKDFIYTKLCHSKFCNNCKKVKQASRMSRYIPELEPYGDMLYHKVFTLPSVKGSDLNRTLKKMSKKFTRLKNYISGHNKLEFIDFSKYGYLGCVRSLEITFKGDLYHPHYHCAFAYKNLELDKTYENVYSYDFYNNREKRLFSEFEIILQKLWYMILNDIRVTKENFDNLELGYSVICNKFQDNDYAELFKYITKSTDEVNNILTYDNFKTLYYSTYKLKQIQGYGCFYRINDSNLEEEVEIYYNDILHYLNEAESPRLQYDTPMDLLHDEIFTLISRKKIYQYLKELKEE